ncbi:hypothetical protein SAMN03159341_112133 [Paenibacillus sp. 1_12]|uniref:DUF6530 family protein n=1 Tax=Paenibacillus sp. 1_12 TaxID=1566278 RepID=UPI0008EDC901|nr:DUF6530 family protein [Paenibacillus sp. 1_12]SFL95220.1 hypothetical protein SAMN03159341_112133 [Paenibacillus sp. 1_12]
MKIQTTVKYKPVIVSESYEHIDGRFAQNTDAKSLSLGLAQRSDNGKTDITAKVWGCSGETGSGHSEELPLHRVLDLAILICRSSLYFQDAYRFPKLYDPDHTMIDRIGLQGGAMNVSVCTENPLIDEDIKLFSQILSEDGELVGERLRVLSRLLKEMGDYN